MTEYKVEHTSGRWADGPLEDWLNKYAKQGWRLVTTAWLWQPGNAEGTVLAFIFERVK